MVTFIAFLNPFTHNSLTFPLSLQLFNTHLIFAGAALAQLNIRPYKMRFSIAVMRKF